MCVCVCVCVYVYISVCKKKIIYIFFLNLLLFNFCKLVLINRKSLFVSYLSFCYESLYGIICPKAFFNGITLYTSFS